MTVKELKEYLKDMPDNTLVKLEIQGLICKEVYDFMYLDDGQWSHSYLPAFMPTEILIRGKRY